MRGTRTSDISQIRIRRPGGAHFFVIPSGVSIERLRHIDPDRDWTDMRLGRDRWVVQPYARLRARGWDVTLGSDVPSAGLVVYHKETHCEVLRRVPRGGHPVLIACRADFRSADEADFEVVQNGCHADSVRVFFVPFWPQPGLIPRDPARGHTVENVAFKGHIGNLTPELRGPEFQQFLERHGMRFMLDTLGERDASVPVPAAWHDYSAVDVVLALRPAGNREHTHKPATKLYNAWLAGVPAILSPDYAFRELRRQALDYIEVDSVADACQALLRLRNDPQLYAAMVANGLERGRDFSASAITDRWEKLLFETLPPLVAQRPQWQRGRAGRQLLGLQRKAAGVLSGASRK
ncbi:MAG: hypothetical protein K0R70_218 [Steroidobacteraceae bacterium]|nr:hypothetical protein [Steroidobacteraceae bacterium]